MGSTLKRCCWLVLLVIASFVAGAAAAETREVTILFTNDFHSAIEPIPAYWMADAPSAHLGGAAELMTLVEKLRREEAAAGRTVLLFDSGDMFTGMLSKLTKGEALMEMMATLRYDAMAIGNHEFDYGWRNFLRLMNRVSFPVLGANIFYKGTEVPFSRPHVILERDGLRIGVIGVIGQDARSVILPSMVADLRFEDPAPSLRRSIEELDDEVDLVVVLAHQGHTGPMQTDAEAHRSVQRDFDADIALCGEVPGIDVFIGGHAHRGIEGPFIHPETGTLIMQTYGYGTRLGYLRLQVDTEGDRITAHQGELLKVWSDDLAPDPRMLRKLAPYQRAVAPTIGPVVGRAAERFVRSYNTESQLGSFSSDVIRQVSGADVAFMNAGGLRDDLPAGEITIGDVQDAFPFYNTVVVLEMTGRQIAAILEQGFTLLRGMIQVSGLRASYDPHQPAGDRLIELRIDGQPVEEERLYRVATNSFLAEGGDLYSTFTEAEWSNHIEKDIAQVIIEYLSRQTEPIKPPGRGRLMELQWGWEMPLPDPSS